MKLQHEGYTTIHIAHHRQVKHFTIEPEDIIKAVVAQLERSYPSLQNEIDCSQTEIEGLLETDYKIKCVLKEGCKIKMGKPSEMGNDRADSEKQV